MKQVIETVEDFDVAVLHYLQDVAMEAWVSPMQIRLYLAEYYELPDRWLDDQWDKVDAASSQAMSNSLGRLLKREDILKRSRGRNSNEYAEVERAAREMYLQELKVRTEAEYTSKAVEVLVASGIKAESDGRLYIRLIVE